MLSEDKKWYRVNLRLMGDNLPIEEIESRLGLEASFINKKGEHVHNNPRYHKFQTNIWSTKYLVNSDVPFEEQITNLLNNLESRADELKSILAFPDVTGELFLGFSSGNGQGGTTFSPKLLQRIVGFGLALRLDLYPPDIDEKEETQ